MPLISLAMLVGLMAMAALPPLNGFAGEWVIYQAFFRLSASGNFLLQVMGPLLAVGLAITGALAVMCMAKSMASPSLAHRAARRRKIRVRCRG